MVPVCARKNGPPSPAGRFFHPASAPEAVTMTPMVEVTDAMVDIEMVAMRRRADIDADPGSRSTDRRQRQGRDHKSRFQKIGFHLLSSHFSLEASRGKERPRPTFVAAGSDAKKLPRIRQNWAMSGNEVNVRSHS
jgi:hypothetical protein